MSDSVFPSMMLSPQDARPESCTCAAACLPTRYSPRATPISPSDNPIPLPHVHLRFDLAPRTGL